MEHGQFDKQGFSSMWFQYELQRSIIEMYVTKQIYHGSWPGVCFTYCEMDSKTIPVVLYNLIIDLDV